MTALCADGIAIERPAPEIMNGKNQWRIGQNRARRSARSSRNPTACSSNPATTRRGGAADSIYLLACDRRDDEECPCPRRQHQSCGHRAMPQDDLHELGKEERAAEDACQTRGTPPALPTEKAARSQKKPIGISGVSVRNSQPMNTTSAIAPPASAATTSALAQPDSFPLIKPQTSPKAAAAHQSGTGVVQTARGTCVFLEPAPEPRGSAPQR